MIQLGKIYLCLCVWEYICIGKILEGPLNVNSLEQPSLTILKEPSHPTLVILYLFNGLDFSWYLSLPEM